MNLINFCAFLLMILLEEIFKGLSAKTRFWLLSLSAILVLSVPVSLATIAINIGSFQFKNDSTEINLKGKKEAKKITNEAEYSSSKAEDRLSELEVKVEKLSNKRPHDPLVKEVVKEFKEFKPTAQQQLENSSEVVKLVEDAIAN